MTYFTTDQILNQDQNVTLGGLQSVGVETSAVSIFNGTTQAAAGTLAHTAVTGLGAYNSMTVYASLVGATGGTLDLYLQYSPDSGTTWVDFAHYAQLAAGASAVQKLFTITKDTSTAITTVGSGSTPVLAANTVVNGDWGDRIRLVEVAGASTSAGAAIVLTAVLSS
jgi:hypothetical protein